MRKKIKSFFKLLGPGFITGASDDDPSGIGTYAQTGARFGYTQLWLSLFTFPLMTAVQEMCGRIGLVTGQGLSGVIRRHYSKKLLYFAVTLLLIANTINIGADLGAMASSAQLIVGVPFIFWLIGMTALTLVLEIFITYKTYAKFLKYLTLSLFAYVIAAFAIKQDWGTIIRSTLIPTISVNKEYLMNIVAFLGTTISPYLFFWQADEEVEEEIVENKIQAIGRGKPKITKRDIRFMRVDTIIGMFFSNFITFFIIITAASTLAVHGIRNIETADQAAQALRPIAGNFASVLFAVGIIGTGLLAVPILAGSASYAIAEAFRWKAGLYRKFNQAHGFYGVITIATIIGLLVNLTPIKPFQMLYYTAIINGIAAPPLLLIILLISNNKKIMGNQVNSLGSNALGIIVIGVMTIAAAALLFSLG